MRTIITIFLILAATSYTLADQTIGGTGVDGPLAIILRNNFRVKVNYEAFPAHLNQYFGESKSTQLSYTVGTQRKKYQGAYYLDDGLPMTTTTNTKSGNTITATFVTPDIVLTLVIDYIPSSLAFTYTFTIQNTGSIPVTDVILSHGGDTYFAGSDSASASYDPSYYLGLLKVTNPGFSTTAWMGLFAISEPFAYYFGGFYGSGRNWIISETANNYVDNNFIDSSINVQFRKSSIQPGQSWIVVLGERISNGAVNTICPTGSHLDNFGNCISDEVIVQYVPCNAGSYIDTSGNCQICPAGTFSTLIDSALCTPCDAESFSAEGSTSCTDCPPGTFSNQAAGSCTPCPHSDCAECQNPTNRNDCTACSSGQYFFTSDHLGCVAQCPFGYYPQASDNTCYQCEWLSLRESVPQSWCPINCCVPGTENIQDGSNIASGCRSDYVGFKDHQVCQWRCPNQAFNANGCNVQQKTCLSWTTMPGYSSWQSWCNTYCSGGAWQCTNKYPSAQICSCSAWA